MCAISVYMRTIFQITSVIWLSTSPSSVLLSGSYSVQIYKSPFSFDITESYPSRIRLFNSSENGANHSAKKSILIGKSFKKITGGNLKRLIVCGSINLEFKNNLVLKKIIVQSQLSNKNTLKTLSKKRFTVMFLKYPNFLS